MLTYYNVSVAAKLAISLMHSITYNVQKPYLCSSKGKQNQKYSYPWIFKILCWDQRTLNDQGPDKVWLYAWGQQHKMFGVRLRAGSIRLGETYLQNLCNHLRNEHQTCCFWGIVHLPDWASINKCQNSFKRVSHSFF